MTWVGVAVALSAAVAALVIVALVLRADDQGAMLR